MFGLSLFVAASPVDVHGTRRSFLRPWHGDYPVPPAVQQTRRALSSATGSAGDVVRPSFFALRGVSRRRWHGEKLTRNRLYRSLCRDLEGVKMFLEILLE